MFTRKLIFNISSFLFNVVIISALLIGSTVFPSKVGALGLAIQVNTSADNTIKDGKCSLREAIVNANHDYQFYTDCTAGFSDDGIFFSNALGTATITLTSALPPVTDIDGLSINGGGDITVSGNNLYRVFAVFGSGSLALDSLTVKNGNSTTVSDLGGGALMMGNGTSILTVKKSIFIGNNSTEGGAIYNHWGTLTINDSTFSGNNAGNNGGAVNNDGGVVTIHNGNFSDNNSSSAGGGIYNRVDPGFAGGVLTITESSFLENTSSLGGAIYNLGALTVDNTDFSRNSAWYAGAIYNDKAQEISITESNFSENVADYGAGIYNVKGEMEITSSNFTDNIGDGIFNIDGTIFVMKGTFAGNGNGIYSHSNTSIFDLAILRVWNSNFLNNRGSGVYNDSAGTNVFISNFIGNGNSGVHNTNASAVTVDRSTFQFNTAEYGGGIYNEGGDLHVHNSTLTENKASYGGGLYNNGLLHVINSTFSANNAKGSGIFNDQAGVAHLYNTILANSEWGGDCQNHQGTVDGSNNLIESSGGDACDFINGMTGNIIGTDPNLDVLTGSPAYLPLNNGSPAIDAGDDVQCGMLINQSQNGVTRPQGAHCDIGSYEAAAQKK